MSENVFSIARKVRRLRPRDQYCLHQDPNENRKGGGRASAAAGSEKVSSPQMLEKMAEAGEKYLGLFERNMLMCSNLAKQRLLSPPAKRFEPHCHLWSRVYRGGDAGLVQSVGRQGGEGGCSRAIGRSHDQHDYAKA